MGEQHQDGPAQDEQHREMDGLRAMIQKARRGKSGVSLIAPQSVIPIYLKESTRAVIYGIVFGFVFLQSLTIILAPPEKGPSKLNDLLGSLKISRLLLLTS